MSNVYDSSTPCCKEAWVLVMSTFTVVRRPVQLPVGGTPYCLFLRDFLSGVDVGKGSSSRSGASVAAGIHFSSVMVLVARSKACWRTWWSGAERARDPTEKHPDSPQVMLVGLGSGLAATASVLLANRTEAVATEAKMKSRIVAIASVKFVYSLQRPKNAISRLSRLR